MSRKARALRSLGRGFRLELYADTLETSHGRGLAWVGRGESVRGSIHARQPRLVAPWSARESRAREARDSKKRQLCRSVCHLSGHYW